MGEVKPSLIERCFGSFLFLILSVAGLTGFSLSAISLISDIFSLEPVLRFNKGAMYLLGASIATVSLFIGVAYHSIYLRKVSGRVEKRLLRCAIIGILIMIFLPQVVHFTVSKIVSKRQYVECYQANYSWLLYKKYVYTKNQDVCVSLAMEITKS